MGRMRQMWRTIHCEAVGVCYEYTVGKCQVQQRVEGD